MTELLPGALYVVATPIGNRWDLSPRARDVLTNADIIAAEDTRHTAKLLGMLEIKAPALVASHAHNENNAAAHLVNKMQSGATVALVTDAGTPAVSDPGAGLVAAAAEAGLPVYAVPGPCAVAAALSISGFMQSQFTFWGFAPRAAKEMEAWLESILNQDDKLHVLYESPLRIVKTMQRIAQALPEASVCLCNDITKLHERTDRGTAAAVAQSLSENPKAMLGEYVLVLQVPPAGPVLEKPALTPEAALVQAMTERGLSLSDAMAYLRQEGWAKNKLYAAKLRLQTLFD